MTLNYVILARVLNSYVGCLVDTGSSTTIVSAAWVEKLGASIHLRREQRGLCVRVASGSVVHINTTCRLCFVFEEKVEICLPRVWVMPGLPADVLIGNDMMVALGFSVSYEDMQVNISRANIQTSLYPVSYVQPLQPTQMKELYLHTSSLPPPQPMSPIQNTFTRDGQSCDSLRALNGEVVAELRNISNQTKGGAGGNKERERERRRGELTSNTVTTNKFITTTPMHTVTTLTPTLTPTTNSITTTNFTKTQLPTPLPTRARTSTSFPRTPTTFTRLRGQTKGEQIDSTFTTETVGKEGGAQIKRKGEEVMSKGGPTRGASITQNRKASIPNVTVNGIPAGVGSSPLHAEKSVVGPLEDSQVIKLKCVKEINFIANTRTDSHAAIPMNSDDYKGNVSDGDTELTEVGCENGFSDTEAWWVADSDVTAERFSEQVNTFMAQQGWPAASPGRDSEDQKFEAAIERSMNSSAAPENNSSIVNNEEIISADDLCQIDKMGETRNKNYEDHINNIYTAEEDKRGLCRSLEGHTYDKLGYSVNACDRYI